MGAKEREVVNGLNAATEQSNKVKVASGRVVRGIVFAALGGICWGFSGTCAQLLTSGMGIPVSWITCARLSLAAIIFLVICLIKEPQNLRAVLRDKRSLIHIAAFALLGVLLTQASYLTAISYTNAGTGTVLERLGVVLIMLYVCMRTWRLPTIREGLGLVLAISGTVLIATQGNFSSLAIPAEGLFWGLVSAFALACYTLIPVKVLDKWGSLIVTFLAMLIGGAVSTAVIHPWSIPVDVNMTVVAVMGVMVVVGTVAAYLFYLQGITDAGPVRAGLIGCIEPVAATVISAVWLGTVVSLVDIIGCAMIIGMVILITGKSQGPAQGARVYDGSDADLPLFKGRASILGFYVVREAVLEDRDQIKLLLNDGHRALAYLGIKEGMKKYPSPRRVARSIGAKKTFLVVSPSQEEGQSKAAVPERILGIFALDHEGDKAYLHAEGVSWLTESQASLGGAPPYAALHWVTVSHEARDKGVGRFIVGSAEALAKSAGCRSVRADVYPDNVPMRRLLEKAGYSFCGEMIIHESLGRTKIRAAYERIL